jgi:hypothetical protein
MQFICLCGMVLMMHVRMTRLPICVDDWKGNQSRERICVTSCYLTTKIPSALLVAVGWLQHTRYPRFRHGTFDYGVTTSPDKRGRVGVRSFMWMHVSITMLPKCICSACSKATFNFNSKAHGCEQDQKNKFRTEELLRSLIVTKFFGAQNLIGLN